MKVQKRLFRHRPEEGIYGDCHRTAIACVLGLDAADVPHFMEGKPAEGIAHAAAEKLLNARGIAQINVLFPGELSPVAVIKSVGYTNDRAGIVFILGGRSKNGCNHSVVCCDGEIVCDPALDDSGIVGPCDDGFYWVTFFGALVATERAPA